MNIEDLIGEGQISRQISRIKRLHNRGQNRIISIILHGLSVSADNPFICAFCPLKIEHMFGIMTLQFLVEILGRAKTVQK